MSQKALARERRVTRKLEARGMKGLGEALVALRGTEIEGRWELGTLCAVGAEGAVYLCHDVWDASQPVRVAKVALLPYHKPFAMSFDEVRLRRDRLRAESGYLETSASRYMPGFLGLHAFANPLLDAARGGEFAEPEPVLVMERLPGFDLDVWLSRVHSSGVPRMILRRNVDHVAVVVLRALWDLHERGYFYCDLRPGNIRIRGRSEHRVRLMDAGSLVPRDDVSGGFPHVPAFLPPDLYLRSQVEGPDVLVPSLEIQAVMAGRTLFEVATGKSLVPGQQADTSLLQRDTVSVAVADTIARLCDGRINDVFKALKHLAKETHRGKTATRTIDPKAVAAAMSHARSAAESAPEPEPASVDAAEAPRDLASVLAAARANFTPAPAASPAAAAAPAARGSATATLEPSAGQPSRAAIAPAARSRPDDKILAPSARRPASWWGRLVAKLGLGR